MSVIRRPRSLGQRTHRRILGATALLSAASVELIAVGTWFTLVSGEFRSVATALVGLVVLLVGSLLRIGVFDAVTTGSVRMAHPRRLVPALVHAGCWVTWLLASEVIGGVLGLVVAAIVLAIAVGLEFELERQAVAIGTRTRFDAASSLGASALVAVGATIMLATSHYLQWTILTVPIAIQETTLNVDVGSFTAGFLVFAVLVFVAERRRLRRELAD